MSGLEDILAEELKQIGVMETTIGSRSVEFTATKRQMYEANLYLRTAIRILKPIAAFEVNDENELYSEIQKINWEEYLSVTDTLAVDSVVYSSQFTHSLFISQKTKDAIVDQFRAKHDARPSVDLDHPTVRVHIYISKNDCTVCLDSSGSSLHKRGYRMQGNEAPLNEVLAAGMIKLSGWDEKSNFVDFMCGSGTILIEAALMARNIAPGIFRNEFGFERWKDFDAEMWDACMNEARNKIRPGLDFYITGCDISGRNVGIASDNIKNADLSDDIQVYKMSFDQFDVPKGGGTLVSNPPYGERMETEDINGLYKRIGDKLKKDFPGYTAWILTGNPGAAKSIGLRPSRKIVLLNSQLECRFLKFDMYDGSKKVKFNKEEDI